jgi:hypothetical protein
MTGTAAVRVPDKGSAGASVREAITRIPHLFKPAFRLKLCVEESPEVRRPSIEHPDDDFDPFSGAEVSRNFRGVNRLAHLKSPPNAARLAASAARLSTGTSTCARIRPVPASSTANTRSACRDVPIAVTDVPVTITVAIAVAVTDVPVTVTDVPIALRRRAAATRAFSLRSIARTAPRAEPQHKS